MAVTQTRNYLLKHVIDHPEIGAVLDSQCGAQSDGCTYDTPDRSEAAAPTWLKDELVYQRQLWAAGKPGDIAAVLASDGWWWKV